LIRAGACDQGMALPGFYYDPNRRRYFRVGPGFNSFNSLTWQLIKRQGMKEKREQIHQSAPRIKEGQTGIPGLIRRRETEPAGAGWNWQKNVTNSRAIAMQPETVLQLSEQCRNPPTDAQLDASNTRVFIVRAVGPSVYCFDCFEVVVSGRNMELKLVEPDLLNRTRWDDNVCMAMRQYPCEPSEPVGLVIGACRIRQGITRLVLFTRDRREIPCEYLPCNMACDQIRCCWQRNATRSVEVAVSRKARRPIEICNVETLAITSLQAKMKHQSDVLCLEFMARSSVLLAGCRNGAICAIDLRVDHQTIEEGLVLTMKRSVGKIKVMQDENYILAMALNGQFGMFDMRVGKCVQEYQQHVGTHKQISFCTNSQESLIFAGGEDRIVRVWDVNQCQPIHQFVPELEQDYEPVEEQCRPPLLTYGSNVGGTGGLFTLIDTTLYFYQV
jgi:WD repeat-containing protein 21A